MKRKLKHLLNSVSTRVILIIIALVFPLNVLVIIYMDYTKDTIIRQAEQNSQKLADYYMQGLDSRMNNAQALLSYFITKDEDGIRLKLKSRGEFEYEETKMKFYYKLRNMASMSDGADGYFYYYKENDDSIVYGNSDGGGEMVAQIKKLVGEYTGEGYPKKEHLEKEYLSGWHIYEWNGKKYLLFLIPDVQVLYGCVIRLDNFLQDVTKSMEYSTVKVQLDESEGEAEGKDAVYISAYNKPLFLNIQLSRSEILGKVSFGQKLLQSLSIVYLVLIPVLYMLLKHILIRPLRKVNFAHQQIEEGNAEYHIQDKITATEYKELYSSFNRMVDNLNQLKIESYEKEISKQKMELRNLQLQIRPHFLLNTFNLIFTLSQRKENGMIQEIILYLSEYFRYIFRNEKELELFTKELRMIQGYIKMASIRYFGNIEAEYTFDPEIDFVRMPPLLLHNFIENAVKYGVRPNKVLHIEVIGRYEDKRVVFTVSDDGNGMNPEILKRNQSLFRGEFQPENKAEHLGLYNSLKRLKYFYGEAASIEVTSEQGVRTSFKISFPYDMEVEE